MFLTPDVVKHWLTWK